MPNYKFFVRQLQSVNKKYGTTMWLVCYVFSQYLSSKSNVKYSAKKLGHSSREHIHVGDTKNRKLLCIFWIKLGGLDE